MPQVHFVSDSHVGHQALLSPRMQTQRPFASIQEHDETLVERWNAVVGRMTRSGTWATSPTGARRRMRSRYFCA